MARFTVLMRMEPTGRCALVRRKRHRALAARVDNALRPTVNVARNLKAMPVQRRLFGKRVMNINRDLFASAQLKGRPKQIAVISPCGGVMGAKGRFS
ncbi:hypothetical protein D3C86_1298540 [compost metagenome]